MKSSSFFLFALAFYLTNIRAQENIYFMNNRVVKAFIQGSDDYDLYYTLDTIADSRVFRVNKHKVALVLTKNDESVFIRSYLKQKRRNSFELGLIMNNASSSFPLNTTITTGDNTSQYQTFKHYSTVNGSFDPLPGAYLGYHFSFGKYRVLNYYLNPNFALVQNHFNYYSEKHRNYSSSVDIGKKEILTESYEIRSLILFFNFNLGIRLHLAENLNLDIGTGVNLPLTIQNTINGFSNYFYSEKGVVLNNDTSYFNNYRTQNSYYYEGSSASTQLKLAYEFRLGSAFSGVFLGANLHLRNTDIPNWFILGMHYYPFQNRR